MATTTLMASEIESASLKLINKISNMRINGTHLNEKTDFLRSISVKNFSSFMLLVQEGKTVVQATNFADYNTSKEVRFHMFWSMLNSC